MSDAQNDPTWDKSYWRSLEQLADDPQARSFLEREFPEGASELPEGLDRRTVLTLLGASLSMAGLAGCRRPVEEIVPFVQAPESAVPGIAKHYATTMPLGLGAYGLLVKSHEGRPTKIEGNELHPASSGRTSSIMQAAILALYDPDRSRSVRHGGEAATWDDFVAAWTALSETHAADGGAGLAVVAESFSSPTLARLAQAFGERFPRARWVTYEPVSDENIHEGIERASGQRLLPIQHLDRAQVILSLDSDFLLGESDSVRSAVAFAAGRRVDERGAGAMNRLYVVEGAYSITGAAADHRLRLRSGRVAAFLDALTSSLRRAGVNLGAAASAAAPGDLDPRWIDAVARDLAAHRGQGLILAGRNQPAEVHAAVLALNSALGNVGRTVTYRDAADARLPRRSGLRSLVTDLEAGTVQTLIVLGGNPAHDAPADLGFAAALSRASEVVHFGTHVDETGSHATWHVPRAHFLESWGDARDAGGTLSVVQPLIEPLFGAKADVEFVGLLAEAVDGPGYDRVRETWSGLFSTGDFESRWTGVLHDGLLADSAVPPRSPVVDVTVLASLSALARRTKPDGIEAVFRASTALFDGRFANLGWLQELPDPITKMTWDNAALLSPATAEQLGVGNEDRVRVAVAGTDVDLPAWIVPGQADGTVVLTLGYGRSAAGRVGNAVGVDVYPLRRFDAFDIAAQAGVVKAEGSYPVAQTQDHGTMAGRPLVREATLEHFREHPEFAAHMAHAAAPAPLWEEHRYDTGHQWGMTIDLNACTGCNACVIACQAENNVPIVGKQQVRNGREMHWLRLDRYFEGGADSPNMVFQPVPCMHCENAPCEQVCPVAATVHDDEGLNAMVYNRCIGTRYCSNNCPYKVRRFNFFNYTKDLPETQKLAQNPEVTIRSRGVMEKCTYCTQRINGTKIEAKLAGRELADGEIRTACQQACPSDAIRFGDIRDPDSAVATAKRDPRNYSLLDEVYTRPRTTYLAKLRNPNPELSDG